MPDIVIMLSYRRFFTFGGMDVGVQAMSELEICQEWNGGRQAQGRRFED